ncbi:endospore germination permease [Brevibacillus sp. B_LB10_24]|uniref:GerAB/ArcD/ProY family transporter n=1 Tax=Brevibacillus sp. B_LB10_24 TaxID=3380645 RepID=UPI0038BAFBCD
MPDKSQVAARQFMILTILYVIGSAILVIPSLLVAVAKQDAWISAIVAVAAGLVAIVFYNSLAKSFPGMTLVQYCEEIFGRWLGKIVSLFFLVGFPCFIAVLTLYDIGDFLATQILTKTPLIAIFLIVMAVVAFGVRLGLEPIARAAEIFFPWVVSLLLLLFLFVSPFLKLENLEPVLANGIKPVLKGAIPLFSFPFFETLVLLMVFPRVKKPKDAGRALLTGVLAGGMALFAITLFSISVLGVEFVERHAFPTYALAKKINIGDFLQRIEAIIMFIWVITIFFRLTILVYVISIGLAQSFNLKEYRMIPLPLGFIFAVMALVIVPNSSYLHTFDKQTMPVYEYSFGMFLPLLLWVVAVLRKKGQKEG